MMVNLKNNPNSYNYITNEAGLTLDDLNRYLPAVQRIDDLTRNSKEIKEGVFYGLGENGLKKIPDNSINLIITDLEVSA